MDTVSAQYKSTLWGRGMSAHCILGTSLLAGRGYMVDHPVLKGLMNPE
jgi:hypothetical protein